MKKKDMKIGKLIHCIGGLVGLPMVLAAQNPIVQTMYTADPAPMVYDGKLFLYTSHDEDASTWFVMNEWKLYSTTDMVNWTDHGAVLSYETFSWAKGDAWAMQCVERDGKFYAYVPVTMKSGGGAIGVAVADSPYGPFHDPLGKPLAQSKRGDIDPTVFIDDDGQAYLYWGNPFCYYVKLNEDMISYSIWKGSPGWLNVRRQSAIIADKSADRKSTRLNSSHLVLSRMPSSA